MPGSKIWPDEMALITCTSHKSSRGRDRRQEADIDSDIDSGCECSLEEIEKMERMDAWSKTLVAIRVLTEFKKRRKKTMEAERVKKENRKNLWRRLRLKLKIFNIFANKISSDDPATEKILKLKRKIGKCKRPIDAYIGFIIQKYKVDENLVSALTREQFVHSVG